MKSSAGIRPTLNAYNETRKFLGYDTVVAPVPRTELVDQLVAEGYDSSVARDYVSLSVERNGLVRVDETVLAHREGELVEVKGGLRPALDDTEADENSGEETHSPESGKSNPQVSVTEDNDVGEWHKVCFTDPEPDVWAREWLSRRFWMGRQGKMPYAPWASRDHPEADEDGNARYKWSLTDNWVTKDKVNEWVEKDTRVDGYVVILEKETDPYTDDPDPYAFIDGDDVRCPETGEVHPGFVELLNRLGMTYADVSTSGSGVHALYEGALPEDVKQAVFEIDTEPWGENDEPPTVEIYDGKHVCVVTGDHVVGTPEHVYEWNEDALNEILDEHLDEADRVTPTEGTDTDTKNPLDDYEPKATGATEKTDEINDVFYAVENLTPLDLPLRTKQVGEDATGWEKWDPSTYRHSSGNDSLHSPPGESIFYDQKTGRSFGLLSLYAVEQGILTKPWETLEGSDWWDAVEAARDDGAPIPEYKPADNGLDPEAVLPHSPKARLITNGWDWTCDGSRGEELRDRIRERTTEKIRDAYEHADRVLLEAIPTSGKSYGAVKACRDSDEDVTILTERRDLYDQLKEWCQELGLRSYTLPAFHRDCPTADGTHGDEWKEKVRDLRRRGATPKEIHAELETPCQDEGACPYSRRWDFDADDYDVLIGNYRHAHVDSVVSGRAVVFDEDTSGAFETVLSGASFKSAVTQYLRNDDGIPFDDFTELLENRDEEIPRDATLEAVGEPEWRPGDVFDGTTTHAGAELAVYALLKGNDLGNGLERATLPDDAVAVFNRETTGVWDTQTAVTRIRVFCRRSRRYAYARDVARASW